MAEWVLCLVLLACVALVASGCYHLGRLEGWRQCRADRAELDRLDRLANKED